ncbi:MAG TPA: orotate phosphoribosyltransferase [Candidatus Kryptobacter bacterium]|nr:orotate phosphoribosyltransferase [Candidatus Kryptobacter bacterium]
MDKDKILELFRSTEALQHSHFRLTSGLHSSEYFQCAKVLQYPQYNEMLCGEIAANFRDQQVGLVVAPAIGGIMVGQEVARQLRVRGIFAERGDKNMSLRRGFEVKAGERVVVCEDVVTTGGSVQEVVDLVKARGGIVVGVASIVDRSRDQVNFGAKFFSLLKMEVPVYQPDACPLCRDNIPIVKPGSRKVADPAKS